MVEEKEEVVEEEEPLAPARISHFTFCSHRGQISSLSCARIGQRKSRFSDSLSYSLSHARMFKPVKWTVLGLHNYSSFTSILSGL